MKRIAEKKVCVGARKYGFSPKIYMHHLVAPALSLGDVSGIGN